MTSIDIPNSVTNIGNYAFSGCTSISKVILQDGINTLKLGYKSTIEGLFADCPITTLHLGRNLSYSYSTSAHSVPFANNTALKSVVIGDSVTVVTKCAFYGCSGLSSLTWNKNLKRINDYAFTGCNSLPATLKIPNTVERIGVSAFDGNTGLKYLSLPKNLKQMGDYAFRGCANIVSSFALGDSLTHIGVSAFEGLAKVSKMTFGCSLDSIGASAFKGMSAWKDLTLPNSVSYIGNGAFSGCSVLRSCKIEDGNNVLELGYNTNGTGLFYDCPLVTIYVGRDLNYPTSGYSPFYDHLSVKSLEVGDSVTTIGNNLVNNCTRLTSVKISDNVSHIGDGAFKGCVLMEDIAWPENLRTLGKSAFENCALITSAVLPEGMESIGQAAFKSCENLRVVSLPNTITSIETEAFNSCIELDSIYAYWESPVSIDYYTFDGVDYEACTLTVPHGCIDEYRLSPYWSEFLNINEMARTFSISSAGWATLYWESALEIPEGMKAYYGTLNGDYLTLHEISGIIPAETAVVLQAAPGNYPLQETDEEGEYIDNNDLQGVLEDTPKEFFDGKVYTLAVGSLGVGFYQYVGEIIGANKAFLEIPVGSKISAVRFGASQNETDIDQIVTDRTDKEIIYDLQGRRVDDLSRKGIYVVGGKKVIVR